MSQPNWSRIQSFPHRLFSGLLSLDHNEFITAPESIHCDGIYKYKIESNQLEKVVDYDQDFISTDHGTTIDAAKKKLFICNSQKELIEIDLKAKPFAIKYLSKNANFGWYPKIVVVEGTIHILGGSNNSKHLMFNKESAEFREIYQFNLVGFRGFNSHKLLHLKRRKCILCIGANDKSQIHEFSLSNNKWRKWEMTVPAHLPLSAVVTTKNEQFIIFLGGYNYKVNECTDIISIYDHQTNKFRESIIKCPKKEQFEAITVNNPKNDSLVTCGFINECFRSSTFKHIQPMPHYLVQLISNKVSFEYIHIVQANNGNHWMLNVDDILCFV